MLKRNTGKSMHNQKKALITGCFGQDGSLLSKSLLSKNYKVIGTTRGNLGNNKNTQKIGIEKQIIIEICDLRDRKELEKIIYYHMPDEIYHLACQSSVGKSYLDPLSTIDSIINGSLNILEICKKINFEGNIFFAGSSEMFGETKYPARINDTQDPRNPYAIGKQASFNLVKMYRNLYNLKCSTGVLFNHESGIRHTNFVTSKIIEGAIKSMKDKNFKLELGNINISRDWGWAAEYVEAMQLINKKKFPKDYIICTGKLTSLKQFLEIAFSKFNLDYRNHVISTNKYKRKSDIIKSFGNPTELYEDLNWKAKTNINQIIEKMIKIKLRTIKTN